MIVTRMAERRTCQQLDLPCGQSTERAAERWHECERSEKVAQKSLPNKTSARKKEGAGAWCGGTGLPHHPFCEKGRYII